jgi:hypothetical protein
MSLGDDTMSFTLVGIIMSKSYEDKHDVRISLASSVVHMSWRVGPCLVFFLLFPVYFLAKLDSEAR